jgi:GTP diphosphokinase / guanosine-3',5'-bis(diphosphate) 3'-diphosphatase
MNSTFARELANRAHEGQKDLAGEPYIGHIYQVVAGVESEDAKTVAYLHDIVEDTHYTLDELRNYFPTHIVDAVDHLTRREGESYADFIRRVKQNKLATEVKVADLEHNMLIRRIPTPTAKDYQRVEKYYKARQELLEEIN